MIETAIRSDLPLIAVQTDDPLNIGAVLSEIAGRPCNPLVKPVAKAGMSKALTPKIGEGALLWCLAEDFEGEWHTLYNACLASSATLIAVNPLDPHYTMFDAGVVTLPDSMLKKFVAKYVEASNVASVEAALRGLSYKALIEVCRMAMATHGHLTQASVTAIRRSRMPLNNGLRLVDTEQQFYSPPPALLEWLALDGRLFLNASHPVLQSRGLIFTGPPGTGKTCGAKYLAAQLNVPLYFVDMSGILAKYVGESERNLRIALTQVESLGPCVFLLDEVEKLFNSDQDTSVVHRLLSMLLWWLQEHKANVLTIMTTNNARAIPPELYRPGRIDRAVEFSELNYAEALEFGYALAENLKEVYPLSRTQVESAVCALPSGLGPIAPVQVTLAVYRMLRQQVVATLDKGVEHEKVG